MDATQLDALRALIDPEVVAAWLDEVESYRRHPDRAAPTQPVIVQRQPSQPEPLLTVKDVSQRLGIGKGVVYRMVHANHMPHIRLGQRIRFVWSQVQAWLDDPSSNNDEGSE